MTGDMDPKTNFALIVIQTELERYKYLVRSYLRARIAKVRERRKENGRGRETNSEAEAERCPASLGSGPLGPFFAYAASID